MIGLITNREVRCMNCDVAKRLLIYNEIPFETIDITEWEGSLGGVRSLPVFTIDGVVHGSLDEIRNYVAGNF